MTREAFENAMVTIMALGGSTNAVLHLIAMARAVDVPLTIDDFQTVSDRVPFLADLKPSGQYVMEDLHEVGGTPGVLRYLLEHGALHGDCLTVTGKTLAENLAELPDLTEGQDVIHPWDSADQSDRSSHDSARQPRPRRIGREDHRQRGLSLQGSCESVRLRRGDAGSDGTPRNRQRRRRGHSLRGTEGRTRDARDALADLGHHGRRPRSGRRAHHRRTFLRRLARLHHRAHHARSAGRRADRAGAGWRHHRHRCEEAIASISRWARPNWRRVAPPGRRPRSRRRVAPFTSTSKM